MIGVTSMLEKSLFIGSDQRGPVALGGPGYLVGFVDRCLECVAIMHDAAAVIAPLVDASSGCYMRVSSTWAPVIFSNKVRRPTPTLLPNGHGCGTTILITIWVLSLATNYASTLTYDWELMMRQFSALGLVQGPTFFRTHHEGRLSR
jgi:hypothetical protein